MGEGGVRVGPSYHNLISRWEGKGEKRGRHARQEGEMGEDRETDHHRVEQER